MGYQSFHLTLSKIKSRSNVSQNVPLKKKKSGQCRKGGKEITSKYLWKKLAVSKHFHFAAEKMSLNVRHQINRMSSS